jgi:hypothetical protein
MASLLSISTWALVSISSTTADDCSAGVIASMIATLSCCGSLGIVVIVVILPSSSPRSFSSRVRMVAGFLAGPCGFEGGDVVLVLRLGVSFLLDLLFMVRFRRVGKLIGLDIGPVLFGAAVGVAVVLFMSGGSVCGKEGGSGGGLGFSVWNMLAVKREVESGWVFEMCVCEGSWKECKIDGCFVKNELSFFFCA